MAKSLPFGVPPESLDQMTGRWQPDIKIPQKMKLEAEVADKADRDARESNPMMPYTFDEGRCIKHAISERHFGQRNGGGMTWRSGELIAATSGKDRGNR